MKICLIHSIFKPYYRGGAEVVFANIAAGLQKRKQDFFVISLGYEDKIEEIDGIKVYRVKPVNLFNFLDINSKPAWLRLPWHLIDMFNEGQTWKIYRILKKEKPDLIYCQGLKGLGYLLPRLFHALKIKFIYRVYDMQLIHPTGLLRPDQRLGFFSYLYYHCSRRLIGQPPIVVFPSNSVKETYERYKFFKRSKKVVLGNPLAVDASTVAKETGRQAGKKVLNLIYLGQVIEFKGVFELIEAAGQLKGEFNLHLAGEGADLNKAKNMARGDGRIIFHGQLNQEQLNREIWPIADLLINPSKVPETFGMVVIESFARSVPVIVSRIGALPELVNENTGWLIEPGNVEEIRKALQLLIDNPRSIADKKASCQQEAKKYSIDNYLDRLFSL